MNYLAMRTQFLALLNRKDCPDTLAKTFFDMGVARCQRDLRVPFMEKELTIDTSTADVSSVNIPNDYLETVSFIVSESDGTAFDVQFLDLGSYQRQSNVIRSTPTYYTRKGGKFQVTAAIPQGSTASIIYYGEFAPLVNDADEPTLALIAPDVIIYSALTYAADYFLDDRGQTWEQKYTFFFGQVQGQASDEENRDGTNAVQPAYQYDDCQ